MLVKKKKYYSLSGADVIVPRFTNFQSLLVLVFSDIPW